MCSLLAHRRFADLLLDMDGLATLLAVPRTPQTSPGIALALFGLASIPSAFERAVALPPPMRPQLVAAALELLRGGGGGGLGGGGDGGGRKSAVLFFGEALATRGILEEFDTQVGCRSMRFP